ncbi:hypothetical protein Htur_5267 (plasmid) [Haloterrigena turkmenica DSM 5511]|uniref:HTH iclR-type domain-containing protein n=1 Tax=Haloterrigena turkmenica (strain ATCC 51198 / DSM 5511 / JCM 9101 / NCIMB 13204 / VKM B-1734 / 4k) TaxID=543526 RepID=D2S3P8_HALTV|nr:hypothetical protein [Haloterrigena turkmenica]ADB63995.1 hypothetical protein Htur_5267 [Haloterrigena turkmenica DSM 5511]
MDDKKTKEVRTEYPSAWIALTQNESVGYIIDALLDLPPHREFNKTELAEMAGVSRNSVGTHMELLLTLDLVEPVEGTTPTRYRFNSDSGVSRALVELEGEVNQAVESDKKQPA